MRNNLVKFNLFEQFTYYDAYYYVTICMPTMFIHCLLDMHTMTQLCDSMCMPTMFIHCLLHAYYDATICMPTVFIHCLLHAYYDATICMPTMFIHCLLHAYYDATIMYAYYVYSLLTTRIL